MFTHWLAPGNCFTIQMFFAVDFKMPDLSNDIYTAGELRLRVDTQENLDALRQNLPIIAKEIRLGLASEYHARRILEIKGISADEKTAFIQEHIANLVKRRPNDFDYGIFTEMQHVLVTCRDEFKTVRESRHMSRIISIHYLFRRFLQDAIKKFPNQRHLSVKLRKARLHMPDGIKTVLGIFIGINFLADNEIFEERHILKAIQNYIPNVRAVKNSFFSNHRRPESICTMYLEIEKCNEHNTDFSIDEIKRLQRELPNDLTDRIEHLMHPVFMPPNEEEVIRNILTLSHQLKYLRDLPQVIISFERQTHLTFSFTIILRN